MIPLAGEYFSKAISTPYIGTYRKRIRISIPGRTMK